MQIRIRRRRERKVLPCLLLHQGSESHFKLTLVSNVFVGKRAVQRHQLVYGALTDQMKKIHALALHLYTDEEWEARRYESPQSPNCMGGGH